MTGPINIMVLCNNEMAIPAMQQLYMSGSLKAVVVPEKNTSLLILLKQMLTGTGIGLVSVNKKNLQTKIKSLVTEKNITTGWMMTFAYIIPKPLLGLLPGGFVNFHYGILPKYRGPNPVLAQMLNGETESGITIHLVDEKIDTGPIVMQQKIPINDTDTFGIQLQKLGMLGASMAMNFLQLCRLHKIPLAVAQDETKAMYFKKPVAADLMINWDKMGSTQIIRLIHACNPWNKGAGALIGNTGINLVDAEPCDDIPVTQSQPGTILALDELSGLKIYCFDNKLIKVNIISTSEGFFAAKKLRNFGIKAGDRFLSPNF